MRSPIPAPIAPKKATSSTGLEMAISDIATAAGAIVITEVKNKPAIKLAIVGAKWSAENKSFANPLFTKKNVNKILIERISESCNMWLFR